MKTEDKDIMRKLFAQLPDEQLPPAFNSSIMKEIRLNAAGKERISKMKNILGYVFCGAIMITVCVFALRYTVFPVEFPDWQSCLQLFEKPDFEALKSPSFLFSLYIGMLALLLLVAETLLRRRYHK
jgi:hypothetical protein